MDPDGVVRLLSVVLWELPSLPLAACHDHDRDCSTTGSTARPPTRDYTSRLAADVIKTSYARNATESSFYFGTEVPQLFGG